jgi:multimeric flavodoxin WrbA
MKIVAVLGSPRPQGNSATLARAFLQAARDGQQIHSDHEATDARDDQ